MAWRGCFLRFCREDLLNAGLREDRLRHHFQQRCGFRREAKKSELKKGVEEEGHSPKTDASEALLRRRSLTPALDHQTPHGPSRASRLVKPLLFTVGFTGCSFGTAAIWQYESLKSRVQSYFNEVRADWLEKLRPQKQGDFRKQINQWWNSLSEGQRTVSGIIAANAVVFCCWRVPSLQRTMVKYFTSNPASRVVSTFVSYVCKVFSGRTGPSLGASGAIMTVLAAVCTKIPEAKLAIIFLPMYTFTAGNALKAIVALDSAGLLLGWRFFDHAAHLGGALFGIWYILYGHELIWKNREPFVKVWHDLRTRRPGGGGGGGSSGGGAGGNGSI
ncbi:presenilins-associated rhomboid-like protein, mitochondrial isoform X2 [Lampris incognitus]|uniref:presenilins-associated rhomboid-like protein, mitochondrial isoform X2 n=1 Tax=Lampris incognitus TaxID=2546036 RepID=UPI0024B500AB|nr:presenilins-associated rhomboid-like protein, mitochondrial isoform X2 [Lampris incognitus]